MADIREKVFNCPLEITVSLVGGKWQCVILWHLRKGALRFSQLKRRLPGITPKMLTQQLRDLEENDLIVRKIYPVIPPKVEYTLSEYGNSFVPVLKSMYSWGKQYSKEYDIMIDSAFQEMILKEEKNSKESKNRKEHRR